MVESLVDEFNRPVHRGDFGLRVPPSQRAMREFFARWRESLVSARKWSVCCRDYVMARLAYISGVLSVELCATRITDVHWELGQWGRNMLRRRGSRGSGPRDRFAYLFEDAEDTTEDLVLLVRLFGISVPTATRYLHAVHLHRITPSR